MIFKQTSRLVAIGGRNLISPSSTFTSSSSTKSSTTFSRAFGLTDLVKQPLVQSLRHLSLSPVNLKVVGPQDPHEEPAPARTNFKESLLPDEWHNYIDRYPEFLPDPINNTPILLNRMLDDMFMRRKVIELPTFYVGSVLAVTVSDNTSATKKSRFVGICIKRSGQLLYADFTLRNIIDGMGVEIRYDLYSPCILSIEVLRQEKRLDENLEYLRDALPEYSTFPENMKLEAYDEDGEVPINKMRVQMNPKPWTKRWERWLLKGVEKLDDIPKFHADMIREIESDPTYTYDLMMEYRRHVTEEVMYNICKKIAEHERSVVIPRREKKASRFLRVTKKDTTLA